MAFAYCFYAFSTFVALLGGWLLLLCFGLLLALLFLL